MPVWNLNAFYRCPDLRFRPVRLRPVGGAGTAIREVLYGQPKKDIHPVDSLHPVAGKQKISHECKGPIRGRISKRSVPCTSWSAVPLKFGMSSMSVKHCLGLPGRALYCHPEITGGPTWFPIVRNLSWLLPTAVWRPRWHEPIRPQCRPLSASGKSGLATVISPTALCVSSVNIYSGSLTIHFLLSVIYRESIPGGRSSPNKRRAHYLNRRLDASPLQYSNRAPHWLDYLFVNQLHRFLFFFKQTLP